MSIVGAVRAYREVGVMSTASAVSVVRACSVVKACYAVSIVGAMYARTITRDRHFAYHVRPTEPPDLACRGLLNVKKSYAFNKADYDHSLLF
jgi:hypothetical protein